MIWFSVYRWEIRKLRWNQAYELSLIILFVVYEIFKVKKLKLFLWIYDGTNDTIIREYF